MPKFLNSMLVPLSLTVDSPPARKVAGSPERGGEVRLGHDGHETFLLRLEHDVDVEAAPRCAVIRLVVALHLGAAAEAMRPPLIR